MLNYDRLQRQLGYDFSDLSLLKLALTHRSYGSNNNERLEFLGDALLNSTIAQCLFNQFPDEKEGVLSRLRASLVKGDTLADIAREFSLSDYLIMGEGELKSGGFRRDSILADVVEAIIGAIFIDSDMEQCQLFIKRIFKQRLDTLSVNKHLKDPKTRLQELLQARQLPLPDYTVVNIEGESHQQEFIVRCDTVLLKESPVASAPSRRQAEKLAAAKVLECVEES
ncbi:MAG: ribonuclease III [Cellvibrionaceae bacterium]